MLVGSGTGRQLLELPLCGVSGEETWSKRPAAISEFEGESVGVAGVPEGSARGRVCCARIPWGPLFASLSVDGKSGE